MMKIYVVDGDFEKTDNEDSFNGHYYKDGIFHLRISGEKKHVELPVEEVKEIEVISEYTKQRGGFGAALVGGALLGPVGAILPIIQQGKEPMQTFSIIFKDDRQMLAKAHSETVALIQFGAGKIGKPQRNDTSESQRQQMHAQESKADMLEDFTKPQNKHLREAANEEVRSRSNSIQVKQSSALLPIFLFKGVATRTRFWLLIAAITIALALAVPEQPESSSGPSTANTSDGFLIALFIYMYSFLAISAARFKHLNFSGWYTCLLFVPLVNILALIVLGFIAKPEDRGHG
jgi:uncharacterized membrane protein YhaH (DUF805 family)